TPNDALAITVVDRAISVLSIIVLGSIAYAISPKRRGLGVRATAEPQGVPASARRASRRPPAPFAGPSSTVSGAAAPEARGGVVHEYRRGSHPRSAPSPREPHQTPSRAGATAAPQVTRACTNGGYGPIRGKSMIRA